MTLEEAIIHAEQIVDSYKDTEPNCKCADEHRQLAEWLKELKAYRETYPYGVEGYPPRAELIRSGKPNNLERSSE